MFHKTPIDKEILMGAFLASSFGFTREPCNLTHRRIDTDRQQVLSIAASIHISNALTQRSAMQIHEFLTITVQSKIDFRINQDDTFKRRQNIIQLRRIGFQELTTCRNIKEDIADREAATYCTGTRFLTLYPRAHKMKTRPHLIRGATRTELHLSYSCD